MYAIWHEFNLDVTPLLKMNAACMKRINEIQGNKSLNKKKKKKNLLWGIQVQAYMTESIVE